MHKTREEIEELWRYINNRAEDFQPNPECARAIAEFVAGYQFAMHAEPIVDPQDDMTHDDMTSEQQRESLRSDLQNVIDRHMLECDLYKSEIIGVIECVKMDCFGAIQDQ